jgi:hypothetical protein
MVVDLGTARAVAAVSLTWTAGTRPDARIDTSTDGSAYTAFSAGTSARYVAVTVPAWRTGDPDLVDLAVT